ncbi:hypothetical protein R1sor_021584 [Riccia sorocarpa]|uniref:Cytochrome P450 n=1 Tax=Riccia sorocarpa TaxID=122646 RepID=A0ABD3GHG7_9MARC
MATMWNGLSFKFSEESYVTLIITLAITVLWLLWSVSNYFRNQNQPPLPPGSFGFPFIGQTVDFALAYRTSDGIERWVQKKIDKHGPVFKWRFLGFPIVMMDQPEGNRFIFQNEGTSHHTFWLSHLSTLLGPDSLITLPGERHKLARRYFNKFLDHTAMSRYLPGVNRSTIRHFAKHWQGKDQVVGSDMTHLYTCSTICNLVMTLEEGPLMDKFLLQFRTWEKGFSSLPINLRGFQYYKAVKARKMICEMLDGLLEQRRKEIAEDNVSNASKVDILNNLLTVPDENGNLLPDSYIKDNLLLMLFAGFGTSSSTLAMVIYYIAKNPHVYKEIVQEHKLILEEKYASGKDDDSLTMEDISAMKYTWRVIKETLRFQPVVQPGNPRKTVTNLEYRGYYIPKGWLLMWNQFSHKNPKYFSNPLKFDPSRWETPPALYTFVPFGGGPHRCLGMEFAKMEMLVFIHHLVRRYSWSLKDPNGLIIRDPFPRTFDKSLITVKEIVSL